MATLTLTPNHDKKKGTAQADSMSGLAGNDTLSGLSGNDTLLGGIGADSLNGGTGNDLLLGDTGNDTLLGGAGNDSLNGGADNDKLDGGAGADTLDGGTGTDTMNGGNGNDFYRVDNIGDRISEAAKATSGIDTVESSIDFTLPLNIEHLILTGLAGLKAMGNALANRITGNAGDNLLDGGNGFDTLLGGDGDDTLNGGTGADTLMGGSGSDTYQISSREDRIIETENGGDQDEVESSISYELPDFIEGLTLTGTATTDGVGNGLDNTLTGNAASNRLQGEVGSDNLSGNEGDDTLEGGEGDDTLDGGDGQDQAVYTGSQSDYNIIPADDADNTWVVQDINGSEGTDRLTGIETLVFADGTLDLSEFGSALPQLDFTDLSVTEGNSGSKLATLPFSLSKAASDTVSVDYTTLDVTATAGSDYTALSGTLSFAPGETRKSLSISIAGDTVMEPNETFRLLLSNPNGLELPRTLAIATLVNDDKPKIAIANASIREGNSGNTQVQVLVSLSAPATDPVTVQYSTLDFTALANSDYLPAQGTLSFSKGELSKPLTLNIKGDTAMEPDEVFNVVLSNPVGASIDDRAGLASITLTDDDSASSEPPAPVVLPTLSISGTRVNEGRSGVTSASLTVSLSVAASQIVTVNYTSQDVTAQANSDYVAVSGSLVFNPGETRQTIQLIILGDTQVEPDERFEVRLSNPANAVLGSPDKATVTLTNDDVSLPTLAISGSSLQEGDSGTATATATVSLSAASSQPVSVNYTTVNVTAQAGSDYTATSGSISFAPGQTSQTIQIPVIGDTMVEADEAFRVTLTSPLNASLGSQSSATVTLTNDDVVLPALSISGTRIQEGNSGSSSATVTVSLSAKASQPVSVNYTTVNGTAQAGSDYLATSGTLSFAPGETSKTLSIPVKGDTTVESDENFQVQLSAATNAVLNSAASAATVTLTNDDVASVSGSYTKGQSVIDLGSQYGKLIHPVQVDGDHWFYYWDVSGDGTSANTQGTGYANSTDYVDHDWLDQIFQQDVNGHIEGENGAPVVYGDGNTDNTYRFATMNGVKLALPTVGNGIDRIVYGEEGHGYQNGTAVSGTASNPTYDDYLAIWDAYNGTGTGTGMNGTPGGWEGGAYWSATPSASGHVGIGLYDGLVRTSYDSGYSYVAVEVLSNNDQPVLPGLYNDTLQSTIDYILPVDGKNLLLLGIADLQGTGNALANQITGNEGHNSLYGREGNDTLLGRAGDDTLDGGEGEDSIDGGDGYDTVIFLGNEGDYKVTFDADSQLWTVEDVNGEDGDGVDEGTDYLSNVEALAFADTVIEVGVVGVQNFLAQGG